MTLGRNLVAGLGNSLWSALINLAIVPVYLHYLGIDAYGLIGFFLTLQVVLSLLDMGMTPTINREVAQCSVSQDIADAAPLLHTLAVIYWTIAIVIGLVFLSLAPLVSEYWLQSDTIPPATVSQAIMLMGLVIATRWPIGLYQGALIGAQRLEVSSIINMIMITAGAAGAILVLVFVSPSIQALFMWQAFIGILHAVTVRYWAWKIVGAPTRKIFDFEKLKEVWRFTAGMTGIALTAIIFTQLDKLLISKLAGLDAFGYYMLATAVVGVLYTLINPTFNVIYPQMTGLVAANDTAGVAKLYRLGSKILAAVIFPTGVLLSIFSEQVIFVWTGNAEVALNVSPIVSILALGSALHCMMYFPYALQLSHSMTQLPLAINIFLTFLLVPLLIFFVRNYGVIGGAWAWLTLQTIYFLLGSWLTHRYLLKGLYTKWLTIDIGIPLGAAVIIGPFGYAISNHDSLSALSKLVFGGTMGVATSFILVMASPGTRRVILDLLDN